MWVLTFARPVCILVLEARPVGTDGEHLLVASGWSPLRAAAMALFALSVVEGALILRRAERSTQPLEQVAEKLQSLLVRRKGRITMTEPINQTRSTANAVDSSPEKLDMQRIAHHVWQLNSNPPNRVNTYLIEDVLVDASTRGAAPRLLIQLANVPLSLVALTHCHPDHQGAASQICETRHIPLACHEADVAAMEGRAPMLPRNLLTRVIERVGGGPAYPVQRILRDGDEIAGFRVIHTPGHTAGHVIYFRESDRVAIVGDVLRSMNPFTGKVGLGEMPGALTVDREESRRSIRKLAQFRPAIICFGHGPVLRDMEQLDRLVTRLP